MLSSRNLLIFLVLAFLVASTEANHKASHTDNEYSDIETAPARKSYNEILEYNKKVLAAYDHYKKKTSQVWGDDAVVPSKKVDVTYRDDLQQRSIVDYQYGSVKVELALEPEDAENSEGVTKRLADAVERTVMQGPDERSIMEIAEQPEPPKSDKPPVLQGLIAKEDGTVLASDEVEAFKRAKARSMTRRPVTGKDGKKRFIFSTHFKLVPDHIRIRAEKYRNAVDRNAQKHRIPTPWIYAIMETESFFNPMAKSPVPAFGLMQLVPATGARDAYKFLYSKDVVVTDDYLYNPTNNIDLGVAYLHILYFRYLRDISDPKSRQWAAIAAYNTGVHNVIRAFSGEYTRARYASRWSWKEQAIRQINKMKPDQVFKHFRNHLPYEETRNYIKKVRDRMGKYRA